MTNLAKDFREELKSKAKITPFEGMKFFGNIEFVVIADKIYKKDNEYEINI